MKIIKQCKQMKKSKGRLPLRAYLAYLLVCTLLLTGITFSKYVTFSDATDSARVAKGLVTVGNTSNPALEVREKNPDTHSPSFIFYVSNNNSEVAITYDIVLTLDEPLPDGVMMVLDEQFGFPSDDGKEYTFSNAGTFEAGKQSAHQHMLFFSINFDTFSGVGTYSYDIDISIESHQID